MPLQNAKPELRLLRRTELQARKLPTGKTDLYDKIKAGLWPPPVKLGVRTVAWIEHECDAVLAARVRGENDDAIRELVAEMVAAREVAG